MSIKFGPDKKKHFIVGVPLGVLLQAFSFYFFPGSLYPTLFAFFILALLCYGLEIFSLVTRRGHADNMDAIAGILGGLVGMALAWGFTFIA